MQGRYRSGSDHEKDRNSLMYSETATALLNLLNTVTVGGVNSLAYLAHPDKRVRPEILEDKSRPRLTVFLYDERFDPSRSYPSETIEFDDEIATDSTSVDSISAPQPWALFYQVEAITRRQHDDWEIRESIKQVVHGNGMGKDLTITFSCAGKTIEEVCHLNLVDYQDMSEWVDNRFHGRVVYSYRIETWLYPELDAPNTIPLLQERILNRARPGTQDESDIAYTRNLDE